jgi:hypothetical protein
VLAAAPRGLATPRHGLALPLDTRVVEQRVAGVAVAVVVTDLVDGGELVRRHVDALGDSGGIPLELLGLAAGQARLQLARLAVERPSRERTVRDQLGARLAGDAPGTAEVIGMRMRDDDGVDVTQLEAGGLQPGLERLPRLRAREPGVDDSEAALVEEAVRIHVAETGHPDRQLHAQDAGGDFDDLLARRLLLLLLRLRRPGCPVGVTRPTRHVCHTVDVT